MDGYSFNRFDACIDIPNGMLPVTMTSEQAIEVVRGRGSDTWCGLDIGRLLRLGADEPAVAGLIRPV